jgi:hypothetical protein
LLGPTNGDTHVKHECLLRYSMYGASPATHSE